jgi:hypothetical protein
MTGQAAAVCGELIRSRALSPGGGFALQPGGGFQVDATAWAILALKALGQGSELLDRAQTLLASRQSPDGRVCLSPEHPEAFWPTSLAILAWRLAPAHRKALDLAAGFLLAASGRHWPRGYVRIFQHDTSIKGWPWIGETHSWVEPTALAIMALKAAGQGGHARVKEAARMLLDRQLPRGGWNYGNTSVFGQELFPFPESTGLALNALKDAVPPEEVRKSLAYLQVALRKVRTPLALGWGLMGLAAWGVQPPEAPAWIDECLRRQERYGPYDTGALSVLGLATRAPRGLTGIFLEQKK